MGDAPLVLRLAILLVVGVAAGFMNTLAGGGSLLTVPALLFFGLPPQVANASNRVAVAMQSIAGATRFRQKRVFELREAVPLLVPTLVGSLLGAWLAAVMDPELFRYLLAVVLLAMLVTIFIKPSRLASLQNTPRWISMAVFFVVGVYGGFVQAGVGFLVIASVTAFQGFDLVKTNAVKLAIVAMLTLVALGTFIAYGQVEWLPGFVLGIGTVGGALLGVRVALTRGQGAIRAIIVVAVVLTALSLFGVL